MKNKTLKLSTLLATLVLSTAASSQAASSIYFGATGAAPFTNIAGASGNYNGYYWAGAGPSTASRSIGTLLTTGTGFVDVSWGQFSGHVGAATYNISGDGVTPGTPFAVDERRLANGATPAGPNWSGFGLGRTVTGLTSSATLNLTNAQTTSVARVSMITGTLMGATVAQGSFTALNLAAVGNTPTGTGYRFGNDQFYYYTPGLTGTFFLDVSWGVFASNANNTGWFLDADGTGNSLLSLATGINQSQFSNGAAPAGAAATVPQWSGFRNVGEVTLNSASRIAFKNETIGGGTVSDLQFTVVPEPATYALLGLGALVLVFRRRRLSGAKA